MSAQTSLPGAIDQAWLVYDLALEVSTLLSELTVLDPMPPLAFSLSRYTQRVTDAAGELHHQLVRLNASSVGEVLHG